MPAERFDFRNASGQSLAALLDRPAGEPRAYALFAHCFTCGKDVHAEIERVAAQHPGKYVAVEWHGPLGWTRFLWCRSVRGEG